MSSDRRTTLHVIVFMGLAALGIVMLMMMTTMEGLQQSQAGTRARIANAVMNEYKFENTLAEYRLDGSVTALHLNYRTKEYLKPDAREAQMKDVARFTYQESLKFEDPELYSMLRVDVTRTEISGSGCFERMAEHKSSLDLPKRLPPPGRATRTGSMPPITTKDRAPGVTKDN